MGRRNRIHITRILLVGMLGWFVQSCAQAPKVEAVALVEERELMPITYYHEFGKKPKMVSAQEIFLLQPQQKAHFLKYLNHPGNRDQLRHKRVSNYLKKIIKGFNYHSDTLIAAQSADSKEGNCLTLAILTTALSRVADVDVAYELMQTPPVYQKKGNTILSSQHIRSVLYEPDTAESDTFFLMQPVIKIDYFPTSSSSVKRKVTEAEFVSMYFRNKAAEAIVDHRYPDAFWLAVESFKYDKDNAHATNMLALIYDRMGFADDAEDLYKFGIEYAEEKLELLSNYHKFLLRYQRLDEAYAVHQQIIVLDEPDPFDWLDLGDEALAEGKYGEAIRFYDKVIELAPYLHHGYSGVGRAEFLKGNSSRARRAFSKASELALDQDTRALYQAKLSALTHYTKN